MSVEYLKNILFPNESRPNNQRLLRWQYSKTIFTSFPVKSVLHHLQHNQQDDLKAPTVLRDI